MENLKMTMKTKLTLFSSAALLTLAMAVPASAAPAGSYQQTCRDIQQSYGRALTAECRARDGSWVEARLENTNCSGDIANMNGRLVCNGNDDNDRHVDRGDRQHDGDGYADNQPYGGSYGDRRDDNRGYDDNTNYDRTNWGHDNNRGYWGHDDVMPRGQLVRRLERQGYMHVRDIRPMRNGRDWRAMAFYRGRLVTVRLNPYTGRVLTARYI